MIMTCLTIGLSVLFHNVVQEINSFNLVSDGSANAFRDIGKVSL